MLSVQKGENKSRYTCGKIITFPELAPVNALVPSPQLPVLTFPTLHSHSQSQIQSQSQTHCHRRFRLSLNLSWPRTQTGAQNFQLNLGQLLGTGLLPRLRHFLSLSLSLPYSLEVSHF